MSGIEGDPEGDKIEGDTELENLRVLNADDVLQEIEQSGTINVPEGVPRMVRTCREVIDDTGFTGEIKRVFGMDLRGKIKIRINSRTVVTPIEDGFFVYPSNPIVRSCQRWGEDWLPGGGNYVEYDSPGLKIWFPGNRNGEGCSYTVPVDRKITEEELSEAVDKYLERARYERSIKNRLLKILQEMRPRHN